MMKYFLQATHQTYKWGPLEEVSEINVSAENQYSQDA